MTFEETLFSAKRDGGGNVLSPEAQVKAFAEACRAIFSTPHPPCPPMDPRWGDKTPEVAEWYRDHQPAEFARRYAGRKTHLSVT